jgi:outer membrane protein assembly factor BamB
MRKKERTAGAKASAPAELNLRQQQRHLYLHPDFHQPQYPQPMHRSTWGRRFCLSGFGALWLLITPSAYCDWPTFGGDAQRSGWARQEKLLDRTNVGTLELKWKIKLDNAPKELTSLTAPIVVDQVKSVRGIKEIVVVAGSSDKIFAIDADTGKLTWQKSFVISGTPDRRVSTLCPFALNATPVAHNGRPKTVYAIASDGKLHAMSLADGEDRFPPLPFVPPFSKNWSLNIMNGILYTAIGQRCNGVPSGVYAIDVNSPDHMIRSFQSGPSGIWGRGGVAVSSTGHVFAETGDGQYDPAAGKFADTILALSPIDVKLTDFYTPTNREWLTRKDLDMGCMTPVIFRYRDKEYLAGGGKEGRLYLLDTKDLGGDDHRTPLYRSELIVNEDVAYAAQGFWGAFATWEDANGFRWLFAPAWGRPHPKARPFPSINGETPHGSIMAFHVEMKEGSPVLTPAWMSRDFNVPEPPLIANGVVYALSSGEDVRQSDAAGHGWNTAERLRGSTHAVLYALDSDTGKELFCSGDTISSFTHFGGIALSNGRVFVSTYDGTVYAFGLKNEEH